jgi:tripartite-type tricarboxylate transporter receptor subunit TctC
VGSHAINPNLHPDLGYDPVRDFAPVSLLASAPLILVVHPSVKARTVQELIALAKEQPGKLNYASNGIGSSSHLAAVMFATMTGIDIVHVPYKGLSPALSDLLAGRDEMMFSSMVAILPHVRAGKLRVLGVTSRRRVALLPDVPTIAESGVPNYEASSWYGILAPAGTPPQVVRKLHDEIVNVLAQDDVRKALAQEGAEPVGNTPEEFAAFIRAEKERLGAAIKSGNVTLQ